MLLISPSPKANQQFNNHKSNNNKSHISPLRGFGIVGVSHFSKNIPPLTGLRHFQQFNNSPPSTPCSCSYFVFSTIHKSNNHKSNISPLTGLTHFQQFSIINSHSSIQHFTPTGVWHYWGW